MILIDAEKLKRKLPLFIREEADAYIDEAEEVAAIPIEWLKNLKQKYLEAECFMSYGIITEIENLWRRENGKEKTDSTEPVQQSGD